MKKLLFALAIVFMVGVGQVWADEKSELTLQLQNKQLEFQYLQERQKTLATEAKEIGAKLQAIQEKEKAEKKSPDVKKEGK
jgi:peptidoglycan hydrolase CwlO-like protein